MIRQIVAGGTVIMDSEWPA